MYSIFKVEKKDSQRVDELYKDDVVSRQSIIKRDGISLELKDDNIYVLVEGSEEAIKKAKQIASQFSKVLEGKELEDIYNRFKAQDEKSLEGMGSIFG
ncbi:MAG: hypothetical protein ACP5F1_00950 [Thermoplasmata archaeon]|nr:hypothetical protein [Thermoplasmata archaeon]